eukprot:CAMPEP_0173396840 /NCGR_PEP_ID=MMETSP1356-20130122/36695_1 /TAXON_ID=77927 ORGANISM="Hemiselmis virescens, Strain PCC157" /NCGR_SAMPLE_ID=MMETSP1356 /ASSEMBLY_ACC=CAM_ASM_000847 /LENGTH=115 /DNA_ID=CAMNT_0014355957 /DNA_START=136 /DNA_END=480 /DNA_ORIENTATION=+
MPPRRKSVGRSPSPAPRPRGSGKKRSPSPSASKTGSTPSKKPKSDTPWEKLSTGGVSALSTSSFYTSAITSAAASLPRSIASPAARLIGGKKQPASPQTSSGRAADSDGDAGQGG